MPDQLARLRAAGYTQAAIFEGGPYTLSLYVRPDCDLDGTFKAWGADEGEWLNVNGWTGEVTFVDCH